MTQQRSRHVIAPRRQRVGSKVFAHFNRVWEEPEIWGWGWLNVSTSSSFLRKKEICLQFPDRFRTWFFTSSVVRTFRPIIEWRKREVEEVKVFYLYFWYCERVPDFLWSFARPIPDCPLKRDEDRQLTIPWQAKYRLVKFPRYDLRRDTKSKKPMLGTPPLQYSFKVPPVPLVFGSTSVLTSHRDGLWSGSGARLGVLRDKSLGTTRTVKEDGRFVRPGCRWLCRDSSSLL